MKAWKKAFMTVAVVTAMITTAAVPALAAPVYDLDANVVSGYDTPTYESGSQYTLVMVKQDEYETTEGATVVTEDNIYFIDQKENGEFTVKPMNDDADTGLSAGTYEVRIGGEGMDTPIITVFTIDGGDDDVVVGDINEDGRIDGVDIALMVQYILENIDFTDAQVAAADTDGNGMVDAFDASRLVQYVLENITEL